MDKPYYFLIADCEGNRANRCRQIGILSVEITSDSYNIYKEYINFKKENPMMILKTAYGDIVQKNMNNGNKDLKIPIFTFGTYDEFLITRKLDSDRGKFRKTLKERFIFFDMQKIITEYLHTKFKFKYQRTLSLAAVSKMMGTEIVYPSHDALADSKTLNNVIFTYNNVNNDIFRLIEESLKEDAEEVSEIADIITESVTMEIGSDNKKEEKILSKPSKLIVDSSIFNEHEKETDEDLDFKTMLENYFAVREAKKNAKAVSSNE